MIGQTPLQPRSGGTMSWPGTAGNEQQNVGPQQINHNWCDGCHNLRTLVSVMMRKPR